MLRVDRREAMLLAIVKGLMETQHSFGFRERPHKVTLRKGIARTLNLGESNKVNIGTYRVRVYWEYDDLEKGDKEWGDGNQHTKGPRK